METIRDPWIQLKESIGGEDEERIRGLEEICSREDRTALKLELAYKRGMAGEMEGPLRDANEFLYYEGERLIGYLGLCGFGGAGTPVEANGMVHPDYRRQGVFTRLFDLAQAEWRRRASGSLLLLTDRDSAAGQAFVRRVGARYRHSEYEMQLDASRAEPPDPQRLQGLRLRKATNADAAEIARQNGIYFGEPGEGEPLLPEDEERRGFTAYLAVLDGQTVGKVHLQRDDEFGAIYGLGVLPAFRGHGLGRALLLSSVGKLMDAGAANIRLQVAAGNETALGLYRSCGFAAVSTMDYYELK